MSKQYGFMIDVVNCTGCKTCQIACKDYKDLRTDVNFRRVYEYTGGEWVAQGEEGKEVWKQQVFAYYTSIACNHCSDPVCVKVCPTKAMSKDGNGFVTVDQDVCIGCKSCANACPYHAPQFNAELKKMSKCDGCRDRVLEGERPVCVNACPLRALDFGLIEELREKYGTLSEAAPLPASNQTQPNLIISPSKNIRAVDDQDGRIGNAAEV